MSSVFLAYQNLNLQINSGVNLPCNLYYKIIRIHKRKSKGPSDISSVLSIFSSSSTYDNMHSTNNIQAAGEVVVGW